MTTDRVDPRLLLAIERAHPTTTRAKYAAVRELGLGDIRYAQALVALLEDCPTDVAVEYGPELRRLQRRRDAGLRQRSARRVA